MKRLALVISLVAAAIMLASGVAISKSINGNAKDNRIVGTQRADSISGGGGNDTVFGKGGADRINGDTGDDTLFGQKGTDSLTGSEGDDEMSGSSGGDEIFAVDAQYGDTVSCGGGRDEAYIDVSVDETTSDEVADEGCEAIYVPTRADFLEASELSGSDFRRLTAEEKAELLD